MLRNERKHVKPKCAFWPLSLIPLPKCPVRPPHQSVPQVMSSKGHHLVTLTPNIPSLSDHLLIILHIWYLIVSRRGDIQAGIASQDLSRTCPAHPMILSPHFFPLPDLMLQGCVYDYVKHCLGSRPSRLSMPIFPPRVLAFFV